MRFKLPALLLAGTLTCGAIEVAAHHAFTSRYRENEKITIEGELVSLVYRNPHSYLHVLAPDATMQMRIWAVECASRDQLRRHSLTETTLRPGDHVRVVGSPGRDPGNWQVRLHEILRPRDGWRWSDGRK
jgi:hypothetical protein